LYKLKVTVQSVKGHCAAGCKNGDVFFYEDGKITLTDLNTNLCSYGICAINSYLTGFCRAEGIDDWMTNCEELKLQCPDIENAVIYQIERTDE